MQSDTTDAHASCIYLCLHSLFRQGMRACISISVRLLFDSLYFHRDGDSAISQAVRQAASRSSLNLENDCKQSGGWLTDAIKKMENMKKFFLLMMACGVVLWGRAQQGTDVLMATLQHGDEVSVYYGKTALEEAYTAAADSGDVVTLSAGRFTFSGYMQKSLTIVGNGFLSDMENGVFPTVITSGLQFKPRDVVDDDGETVMEAVKVDGVHLEGLKIENPVVYSSSGTVRNLTIKKCLFTNPDSYGRVLSLSTSTENVVIQQCVLGGCIDFWEEEQRNHQNFYIVGSFVDWLKTPKEYCTIRIDHSIVRGNFLNNVNISNSIMECYTVSGSVVNNCIFLNQNPSDLVGAGNWVNCKYAGIFEESMNDLAWDGVKTFKLKYPEEYIGTDGTQVGLYGGPYPYNPTPSIPQIKESHIDTTVAANGKLKVSVTVEAQTED